jgi:hypothetical protein
MNDLFPYVMATYSPPNFTTKRYLRFDPPI